MEDGTRLNTMEEQIKVLLQNLEGNEKKFKEFRSSTNHRLDEITQELHQLKQKDLAPVSKTVSESPDNRVRGPSHIHPVKDDQSSAWRSTAASPSSFSSDVSIPQQLHQRELVGSANNRVQDGSATQAKELCLGFTKQQLHELKAQILAFRHIKGGRATQAQESPLGFTNQQKHVLRAQMLVFRRIKNGGFSLSRDTLQAIAPPPLVTETQEVSQPN